ncbi:hypothetical protein A8F94_17295 [Bacillus sp. FJAT-27225]|uniref:YopX family protein n=1 Tax=Bacillus sp. FJAT-27225 TaxID=1743144 RepID=UPI00080C23DE|nr:YopX family protein [Bacillus sp. FJAT-27225]OCA84453.1 hypothetical protein A8F94_17295 [Bacillus sp. FJAT-27225]
MMRDIKFRGVDLKSGKWIYGSLVSMDNDGSLGIASLDKYGDMMVSQVDKGTVGQYTGIIDKNGVEIFEGDIVRSEGSRDKVVFKNGSYYLESLLERPQSDELLSEFPVKVVGNIHRVPDQED